MASLARRLPTNVDGDFFVDETCIDCGACRWMAPETFDRKGDASRVHRQPEPADERRALQAAIACPTGSIGAVGRKQELAEAASSFPHPITTTIFHCGFHDERSFGAASYFVTRPAGNVLVDVPRFHRGLVKRLEALGGVRWLFLTHRDDVAQHERFAAHFGCTRVMHEDDRTAGTASVEQWIRGDEPVPLADDLLVIPTSGHTRGSACLLHDGTLFSGDHVAYQRAQQRVYAFRGACWYDWATQTRSMERLLEHRIERILPGHGAPCHFPAETMHEQLAHCVAWMREA